MTPSACSMSRHAVDLTWLLRMVGPTCRRPLSDHVSDCCRRIWDWATIPGGVVYVAVPTAPPPFLLEGIELILILMLRLGFAVLQASRPLFCLHIISAGVDIHPGVHRLAQMTPHCPRWLQIAKDCSRWDQMLPGCLEAKMALFLSSGISRFHKMWCWLQIAQDGPDISGWLQMIPDVPR